MGKLKIVGIIFLLLTAIAGVVGYDAYLTIDTLSKTDIDGMISSPLFFNENNTQITITVEVNFPDAGFIPKGMKVTAYLSVEGKDNLTTVESLSLGDSKIIALSFELGITERTKLATGGSLTVSAVVEIVPVYLGFEIDNAAQTIDLGSQTIQGR